VYVLEMTGNLSYSQIEYQVSHLINTTKN
jgi:hypothetical protein